MPWPPPSLSRAALRAWTLKLQQRQGGCLFHEKGVWCWLLCKSPPHTMNHSAAASLVLCSSQVPGDGWVMLCFTCRAEQRGGIWTTHDAAQATWNCAARVGGQVPTAIITEHKHTSVCCFIHEEETDLRGHVFEDLNRPNSFSQTPDSDFPCHLF